jgi:hypothetical protein
MKLIQAISGEIALRMGNHAESLFNIGPDNQHHPPPADCRQGRCSFHGLQIRAEWQNTYTSVRRLNEAGAGGGTCQNGGRRKPYRLYSQDGQGIVG